jgi:hypothetical protein
VPRPGKTPRRRLGWLGPALLALGVAAAGVGIWYIRAAAPLAGAVIDTFDIGSGGKIVINAEAGSGDRAFVSVYDGDALRWQELIPHYAGRAGRPAVSWSTRGHVMSVRVERDHREELWALGLPDGEKGGALFLAPEHEPIAAQLAVELPAEKDVPLSVHDDTRSFELVSGPGWHQLVGIDLPTGKALWKLELGPEPITRLGVADGRVDVDQGAARRQIDVRDGHDAKPT